MTEDRIEIGEESIEARHWRVVVTRGSEEPRDFPGCNFHEAMILFIPPLTLAVNRRTRVVWEIYRGTTLVFRGERLPEE